MKKSACILLAAALLLTAVPTVCLAEDKINVTVDGQTVDFDVEPRIINKRTMVPMRAIFEKLGAYVEWIGDTKTIIAQKEDTLITLAVDSNEMLVSTGLSTSVIELDAAATIIDKRTLVPARAIAESLSCTVKWENDTKTVLITTENNDTDPPEEPIPIEEESPIEEKSNEYIYKMDNAKINRTIITGAADPELFEMSYTNAYLLDITKTRNDISNELGKYTTAYVMTPKYAIARMSQQKTDKKTHSTSMTLKDGQELYNKFSNDKQLKLELALAYPVSSKTPGIKIKAIQGNTELDLPVSGSMTSAKHNNKKVFPYVYTTTLIINQDDIDAAEDIKLEVMYTNSKDFSGKNFEKYSKTELENIMLYYTVNFSKFE